MQADGDGDGAARIMFWSDGNTYRVVGDGLFPNATVSLTDNLPVSDREGSTCSPAQWRDASKLASDSEAIGYCDALLHQHQFWTPSGRGGGVEANDNFSSAIASDLH